MPVSGLVVTLCDEAQPRCESLDLIGQEPRITVGTMKANRLAIVLDTTSSVEDKQLWGWLNSLSGVRLVEIAYVGFEREDDSLPVHIDNAPSVTQCKSS